MNKTISEDGLRAVENSLRDERIAAETDWHTIAKMLIDHIRECEATNSNLAEGDVVPPVSGSEASLPPLQKEVLGLFEFPIRFDKEGGYLFDARNQMVGEVRAWGYLQKFENGGALQDELGEMICSAFNQKYGGNDR